MSIKHYSYNRIKSTGQYKLPTLLSIIVRTGTTPSLHAFYIIKNDLEALQIIQCPRWNFKQAGEDTPPCYLVQGSSITLEFSVNTNIKLYTNWCVH